MRKIRFILFIAVLFLVGCNSSQNRETPDKTTDYQQTTTLKTTTENTTPVETTTEEPTTIIPEPTEATLAIRAVLKNERPFLDANNGYKEVYRDDYSYFQGNNNANIGWWTFTMFDIGNDRNRAVWITVRNLKFDKNRVDINDTARLIFRYYNGQVYGYQCNKIIGLRDDEYFIWNSENLLQNEEIKHSGGGKMEFENEKIKYIFYIYENDEGVQEWLKNLMQNENIEIIENNEMCDLMSERYYEKLKYGAGDSNLNEDIDKYIY